MPSGGLFEFNALPFGLSNAGQSMQRLLDTAFGSSLEHFVFVYLDEVVIATPTFQEHFDILGEVYKRSKDANLIINLDNLTFFFKVEH